MECAGKLTKVRGDIRLAKGELFDVATYAEASPGAEKGDRANVGTVSARLHSREEALRER